MTSRACRQYERNRIKTKDMRKAQRKLKEKFMGKIFKKPLDRMFREESLEKGNR